LEPAVAAPLFERALAMAPTNSRVLVGYGLLRTETGHPDEGLEYALRGLGYEPQDGVLHHFVGRIYMMRGEHDKASAHFREAARIQPHYAGNHFFLAYALQQANHLPQAAKAFEEGRRVGQQMDWHHRVVTKLGAEIYTPLDRHRAIEYWEQYVTELRRAPAGDYEQAEIAAADAALQRLRVDRP
jgi:tetratricopeptide (TPR) repeat protein